MLPPHRRLALDRTSVQGLRVSKQKRRIPVIRFVSCLSLAAGVATLASLNAACNKEAPPAQAPQAPTQGYGAYPQQPGQPAQGYPQQPGQPYAAPQAYPQQPGQPAPGYPQQPGQPAPGYPQQPMPGPAAPGPQASPFPGLPGAGGSPGAGGAPSSGGTAQAMDPNFAAVAAAPLGVFAATEAPGMQKDGPMVAGNFTPGQTLEGTFTFQPGKCYTLVAQGVGITSLGLEMQYVTPLPGFAPSIGMSTQKGAQASIGGKANCLRPLSPFPAQAKFIVTANAGSGMAAAQLYSK